MYGEEARVLKSAESEEIWSGIVVLFCLWFEGGRRKRKKTRVVAQKVNFFFQSLLFFEITPRSPSFSRETERARGRPDPFPPA
jgi:hypothetical protein